MSAFDLSHEKKMSLNMGELIPVFWDEVLPSDQYSVNTEVLMRMSPMIAPIMHKVDVFVHYFFVPNRIIWSSWEDFITGGKDGTSAPALPFVRLKTGTGTKGGLADYFGVPVGDYLGNAKDINALPIRAYVEIYNEYYRDQNLTDPIDYEAANWNIDDWDVVLKRCWEKDYFTSALPWTQRGSDVTVDIDASFTPQYKAQATTTGPDGSMDVNSGGIRSNATLMNIENLTDPQNVDDATLDILELRRSARLQEFFEKAARAGSRYKEQLLAYFGVTAQDQRLDRPEYLGGGKQPLVVSEVLNTSATATEPQGNMAGHGITVGGKNTFKKTFKEHGYVIGIMSVLPRTNYQQGLHRFWTKDDRFDWYFPEFANLGEQAVTDSELYRDPAAPGTSDTDVFGYQQRYAEYKYRGGSVHGDFRDDLDFWHMGRVFSSQPSLNTSFVESDPTDRIFAVQTGEDTLYAYIHNDVKARRPMPYFSDPRL
jgi:hypothetical protein